MKQTLHILASHLSAHPNLEDEPMLRAEHDFVTQVWDKERKLKHSSKPGHGPDRVMPEGFSSFGGSSVGWRTFTAIAGDYALQIAQPQALRRRTSANIALLTMLPVLAIIPLAGVIVWLIVGYSLKPLLTIASEVQSRDPASLGRIEDAKLPSEVAPLIAALNDLMVQLDNALKNERVFIAEASHELKTPVTALKLQLGLIETATTPQERDEATRDLSCGITRLERLVEQLLTLARLDPSILERTTRIDLSKLVCDVLSDCAFFAATKSIKLVADLSNQVVVRGDAVSWNALIRNFLDNAIRFTPEGGTVTIDINNAGGTVQVRITDTGPGIPANLREKVFARFFRGHRTSEDTGTGLGLAIAKRAAERLGASVELTDGPNGRGLTVSIHLPSATQTQRVKGTKDVTPDATVSPAIGVQDARKSHC